MTRVLLVLLLTFMHGVVLAEASFRHIQLGAPYPQFCAQQYAGEQFCSEKLKGKIVVLAFFRIDQQLSQRNMVRLQEIYTKYRGKNVAVVAITTGKSDPQALRVFLKKNNIEFPVLLDRERKLYGLFGVIASPSTGVFAVDKTMHYFIASKWINYKKFIEAHIRLLLKEISAGELEEIMQPQGDTADPDRQKRRKAINNYNLAKVLFEAGNTIKALEILNLSMESFPGHAPTHVLYGKIAIEQQDYAGALSFFDRALELNPALDEAQKGRQLSLDYLSKKK